MSTGVLWLTRALPSGFGYAGYSIFARVTGALLRRASLWLLPSVLCTVLASAVAVDSGLDSGSLRVNF